LRQHCWCFCCCCLLSALPSPSLPVAGWLLFILESILYLYCTCCASDNAAVTACCHHCLTLLAPLQCCHATAVLLAVVFAGWLLLLVVHFHYSHCCFYATACTLLSTLILLAVPWSSKSHCYCHNHCWLIVASSRMYAVAVAHDAVMPLMPPCRSLPQYFRCHCCCFAWRCCRTVIAGGWFLHCTCRCVLNFNVDVIVSSAGCLLLRRQRKHLFVCSCSCSTVANAAYTVRCIKLIPSPMLPSLCCALLTLWFIVTCCFQHVSIIIIVVIVKLKIVPWISRAQRGIIWASSLTPH